tara:strand:+ start:409 stop:654 length:246 start_codon:yes stop_codon:yes gene_type:complete
MKYKVVGDVIVNSRGDVMAHYTHGKWETKNDEVLEFITELEKPVVVPVKDKPAPVEVTKEVKKTKSMFRKSSSNPTTKRGL